MRLVLRPRGKEMTREESFAYYQSLDPREMFDVKDAKNPAAGTRPVVLTRMFAKPAGK